MHPAPRHITEEELSVLEGCLHRWRTEVENDTRGDATGWRMPLPLERICGSGGNRLNVHVCAELLVSYFQTSLARRKGSQLEIVVDWVYMNWAYKLVCKLGVG